MTQNITPIVRWTARLISLGVLAFWGFMLIGHMVGDQGRPSRGLVWQDYALLSGTVVSLAGLALAWRWELVGAILTLGAVAVTAALNWRVLTFPGALVPAAAILFLASWASQRVPAAAAPRQKPLV